MDIQTLQLDILQPATYNPREISKEEFQGLVNSLQTFGQQENLVVNKDLTIISGHQRYEAMKSLGWTEAICNVVDLDKHQEKKLNVIMNSQAISGTYDDLKLAEILEELKLDDDYESLRLDALEPLDLSDVEVEEDEAPEVSSEPPISKLGEVYQLGRHRVMCGDSTSKSDTIVALLNGAKADMVFTDPPYNTGMGEKNAGSTRLNHMFDDNKTEQEFKGMLVYALQTIDAATKGEAAIYVCIDWRKIGLVKAIIEEAMPVTNVIVWDKMVHGLGSDYKYTYEMIIVAKKGKPKINNRYGTEYQDIWHVQRTMGRNDDHATAKPVALCAIPIKHASKKDDMVLDLFGGSGSTLIACEQLGRVCYMMELDPKYVDVIRKRWWKFTHDGNEEGWEDGTTN